MQIHKHLFTVMIFILLFVYALTVNSLYQSRMQYKRRAELSTQNLSQTLALNVQGIINKIDVGLFSTTSEVKRQLNSGGINNELLQAFLLNQKKRLQEFEGLWVADEKGDIRWGTELPANKKPVNITDREYFQRLKNDPTQNFVISKPVMGRITKAWSILIAQRINKPDGSMAGVVLGSLRVIEYFSTLFSSIDIGKNGAIDLRDDETALIVRYPLPKNMDALIGSKVISAKSREKLKSNPENATYVNISAIDQNERILSYKRVNPYPLYIFIAQSTDELYKPWKKDVTINLIMLAIFTLLEFALARILYLRAKELETSREVERRKFELEMEVQSRQKSEEELKRKRIQLESIVKERTAKLEATNEELESFSYSVSHDLRSPLRGINGWSLALEEDCGHKLDDQGRNYLNRVRSETKRMEVLIDDLLKLSKISRTKIEFKKVNLTSIAEVVVNRMKDENSKREITFIIQPNMTTLGDAHFLEIALTNLYSNACKFTAKIDKAIIEFGETVQNGEKVYFVRDNGVGFNMNTSDKLFGVFQRMHRQSEYPGTGIGLATVKRIITIHNGKTWAESMVNNGATFYFTLKANEIANANS